MKTMYKNEPLIVEHSINCAYWPDSETPVSIWDDKFRADWYNAGEGITGDYNPEDPNDVNLLRFDIYYKVDDDWEEVEDASYCTNVAASTDVTRLRELLQHIFSEYRDTDYPSSSVKKIGERLSWITA